MVVGEGVLGEKSIGCGGELFSSSPSDSDLIASPIADLLRSRQLQP